MKKLAVFLALFAFFTASSAFAADYDNVTDGIPGGRLICGATDTLEVGVSPKVAALYRETHTGTTPPQWYLISTVHIGGTEAYATAQDITKTFKKSFKAGDDTAEGIWGTLATVPTSENEWSTGGWSY